MGGRKTGEVSRYSETFKRKMVARMTGPNAISASKLAKETGLKQVTLSFWLQQARSLPFVTSKRPDPSPTPSPPARRSAAEKGRILSEASQHSGEAFLEFLKRENVSVAEFEAWRLALEDGGIADVMATKRIKALERELALCNREHG
jgi:transposase